MSVTQLLFNTAQVFDRRVGTIDGEMAEASVDTILELPIEFPNLPPRTIDRVNIAGNRIHEGARSKRDGVVSQSDCGCGRACNSEVQGAARRSVPVAIANITCGNAQDGGADEFNRQSNTVGSFDAHVRVALRDAVGRDEAAIAACRACRAAVNECN
eukprot:3443306-Pleurochrysis_carterae.AAC.1